MLHPLPTSSVIDAYRHLRKALENEPGDSDLQEKVTNLRLELSCRMNALHSLIAPRSNGVGPIVVSQIARTSVQDEIGRIAEALL